MSEEFETRLREIFVAVLELDGPNGVDRLTREECRSWDSLAHVRLVAATESEFAISIDVMDSMDLKTFESFRSLLAERSIGRAEGRP
jgi:acyl carrier protein